MVREDFESGRLRLAEAVGGGWILLVNGYQVGGMVDASGAGDKVFSSKREALKFYVDFFSPAR